MSFWIYKQFGRVIGQKEWDATLALALASWYEKPYYKFIIWNEKRKRYNSADIKLNSDNPWKGCLYNLIYYLFCIFIILIFIILFIFSFIK